MAVHNIAKDIWAKWEAEGNVRTIPKEEVQASNDRINKEMEEFRIENLKKAHQSQIEAAKIVLNG